MLTVVRQSDWWDVLTEPLEEERVLRPVKRPRKCRRRTLAKLGAMRVAGPSLQGATELVWLKTKCAGCGACEMAGGTPI